MIRVPAPAARAERLPLPRHMAGRNSWRYSMRTRFLIVLALLLAGFALAQDATPDLPAVSLDPTLWFGSAAAFAAVIVAVVGIVKTHVIKTLHGLGTLALSYGLGVGGAVAFSFTPYFQADLVEAVTFGVTASTLASGGWDAVRGVLQASLGKGSA